MSPWIILIVSAAFIAGALLARLTLGLNIRPGEQRLTATADETSEINGYPRWRQVLDGFPDAALVLDGNERIEAANASAQALLGAAKGQSFALIYRSPELLSIIGKARTTGVAQSCETRMFSPIERQIMATAAPLRAVQGTSSPPVLVVLKDATAQHQLLQMRADFVANASHELRTPLASLRGFIETLQGAARRDDAARERFLPIMQEQANRMSRLIDDLLSLSQIEMRVHVPPRGEADLSAIAREAVQYLLPVAQNAKVTLAHSAQGDNKIIGERDELLQVAQNLVQNAIKYGKPGGRVDVSVERVGKRVSLSVADDGIGIAPEHLPRLTERFYRVNAKESRERGGTGLGLAIVKHIVNRHQGELKVVSKPGQGSKFTVTFPSVLN